MWENFPLSVYWIWFLAAFACLLVELLIIPTSGFLLCFAASAAMLGGITLCVDLSWNAMLGIFAALCLLSVSGWWWFLHKVRQRPSGHDVDTLTDLTGQLVGYIGELTEPVRGGKGRMRVNDTTWSVEADKDYPAGTLVRVVEAKGIVLQVTLAE